jgi:hypothetical protein
MITSGQEMLYSSQAPVEHLCAMSRHGRAESRYLMRAVTNMEVPIARGEKGHNQGEVSE